MEIKGQYLSYNEYRTLGGLLDQPSFNLLEFEARKEIDKNTLGRLINLKEQTQEVKLCIYSLMNKIKEYNETKDVTSVSIDGYSETYSKPTNQEERQERSNIIYNYLIDCKLSDGTPYLYRG